MERMTLALAKHLLVAAVHQANRLGIRCDIAIVDDGGNLTAFYRMDGARIGDIDVSVNKAWTAVALQMPTASIAAMAQPGGDAFGINTTNQGRLVILSGGLPFANHGNVIGGIGVSGGTGAQDADVAQAAIHAFTAWSARYVPE